MAEDEGRPNSFQVNVVYTKPTGESRVIPIPFQRGLLTGELVGCNVPEGYTFVGVFISPAHLTFNIQKAERFYRSHAYGITGGQYKH